MKKKIQQVIIESWNETDQNEFWKSYRRKHNKLDFVFKTANQLCINQQEEIAINLFSHFVEDYQLNQIEILSKEKYPILYKHDILKICLRVSKIFEKRGNIVLVEEFYKKGESIYLTKEKIKELRPKSAWDGYLSWTRFYIDIGKLELALKTLNKFENSHTNHGFYGIFMDLHLQLARLTNDFSESDRIHYERRKWNDLLTYDDIENQDYINSIDEISNDPVITSEAIVAYHHISCKEIYDKDELALKKLDQLLKNNSKYLISSYTEDFLNKNMIPGLGSYLGEVLIHSFKGKWIQADKLMHCRVEIENQIINPFLHAYKVVHYGHSLIADFYNFEKIK